MGEIPVLHDFRDGEAGGGASRKAVWRLGKRWEHWLGWGATRFGRPLARAVCLKALRPNCESNSKAKDARWGRSVLSDSWTKAAQQQFRVGVSATQSVVQHLDRFKRRKRRNLPPQHAQTLELFWMIQQFVPARP